MSVSAPGCVRRCSKQDTRHLKVCRFGDNMREVAVTDGDKVAAQIKFGFSVNTWAVGDLVQVVNSISDGDVNALVDEYESCYTMTPATQIHGEKRQNVLEAARIELGMKRFWNKVASTRSPPPLKICTV